MSSDAELFATKERAATAFMALPGVTAVGIGGRERDGRPTGELVIKVFVNHKRPLSELSPGETLPEQFEGIGIDVVELGPAQEDVGPPGRPEVPERQRDDDSHRPLIGGSQVQADLTGAGGGTLGCFLTDLSDPDNKVYLISNYHVLGAGAPKINSVIGTTRVGQPLADDSITKCCSSMVGVFAGGSKDTTRDAAVARLNPGMKWRAEIREIGAVKGIHAITSDEAKTLKYEVRKRGIRTRLTGGTVHSIGTTETVSGITRNNLIIVKPNPDPTQPAGTQLFFSMRGDSGSAVVNAANEVVGLHFAGYPEPNDPRHGWGRELPITDMIATFNNVENLQLGVATATATGIDREVPKAAVTSPVPTASASVARLRADLEQSATGRRLVTFWLGHSPELTGLVETNRRVTVSWHRNGGSALLQTLMRMVDKPALTLPTELNGRPLADCVSRIHDGFAPYASTELRRDLAVVNSALPDLGGMSYPEIIDALGRS